MPRSLALTTVLVFAATMLLAGCQTTASAQDEPDQRVELGTVDWMRDFDAAQARSRETGKPIFVLFTEVPGCSTVQGYGERVLSHSLVAEAIQSEFVPVAIFNNKAGDDREVLESFDEPTWNNPAVRIIEADRSPLAPRLYGDYSVEATIETIVTALERVGRDVPGYLTAMQVEAESSSRARTATFGMYCFWSGEVKLGGIDGVLATRPGFLEGGEVVEVTFDPREISLEELVRRAKQTGAASRFWARDKRQHEAGRAVFGDAARRTDDAFRYSQSDDNYQIKHSGLDDVAMTDLQATKVNSALGGGVEGGLDRWLSPGQRARAE